MGAILSYLTCIYDLSSQLNHYMAIIYSSLHWFRIYCPRGQKNSGEMSTIIVVINERPIFGMSHLFAWTCLLVVVWGIINQRVSNKINFTNFCLFSICWTDALLQRQEVWIFATSSYFEILFCNVISILLIIAGKR